MGLRRMVGPARRPSKSRRAHGGSDHEKVPDTSAGHSVHLQWVMEQSDAGTGLDRDVAVGTTEKRTMKGADKAVEPGFEMSLEQEPAEDAEERLLRAYEHLLGTGGSEGISPDEGEST